MKTQNQSLQRFSLIAACFMLALFTTLPGISQEPEPKDSKQTVKIKIVEENDGQTIVIDTVTTKFGPMDREEMMEMMGDLKKQMKELEVEMWDMDGNMKDLPGMEGEAFDFMMPPPPPVHMRREHNNRGGSLLELLGRIPMERVKSYSIKDHKDGKRIVIDIEDGPVFEQQDRTIVINRYGKSPEKPKPPKSPKI